MSISSDSDPDLETILTEYSEWWEELVEGLGDDEAQGNAGSFRPENWRKNRGETCFSTILFIRRHVQDGRNQ